MQLNTRSVEKNSVWLFINFRNSRNSTKMAQEMRNRKGMTDSVISTHSWDLSR